MVAQQSYPPCCITLPGTAWCSHPTSRRKEIGLVWRLSVKVTILSFLDVQPRESRRTRCAWFFCAPDAAHLQHRGSFAAGAEGDSVHYSAFVVITLRVVRTISAERPYFPPVAKKGLLLQSWFALVWGSSAVGQVQWQEGRWGAAGGLHSRRPCWGVSKAARDLHSVPQTLPGLLTVGLVCPVPLLPGGDWVG